MTAPKMTGTYLAYELEDGTIDMTRVPNSSLVAWDDTRSKFQWPTAEQNASRWQTFILWHALTRSGRLSRDVTYTQFADELCIQIDMVDKHGRQLNEDGKPVDDAGNVIDDDNALEVDPTRPADEPSSSSP